MALHSIAPNLTGYAKTAEIADRLAVALQPYERAADLPAPPDMSSYAKLTDVPQFVASTPMTVAALLATYPANAARVGKYARVSDLYGSVDEVMRCCSNGTSPPTYYWRPQRADYAQNSGQTGGAMALTPLVTPPIMFLTGTLASALTITPSAANAWPGCTFEVVSNGVLGLFGITIAGLVGVSVPLVSGGSKLVTFDGTAFRARP